MSKQNSPLIQTTKAKSFNDSLDDSVTSKNLSPMTDRSLRPTKSFSEAEEKIHKNKYFNDLPTGKSKLLQFMKSYASTSFLNDSLDNKHEEYITKSLLHIKSYSKLEPTVSNLKHLESLQNLLINNKKYDAAAQISYLLLTRFENMPDDVSANQNLHIYYKALAYINLSKIKLATETSQKLAAQYIDLAYNSIPEDMTFDDKDTNLLNLFAKITLAELKIMQKYILQKDFKYSKDEFKYILGGYEDLLNNIYNFIFFTNDTSTKDIIIKYEIIKDFIFIITSVGNYYMQSENDHRTVVSTFSEAYKYLELLHSKLNDDLKFIQRVDPTDKELYLKIYKVDNKLKEGITLFSEILGDHYNNLGKGLQLSHNYNKALNSTDDPITKAFLHLKIVASYIDNDNITPSNIGKHSNNIKYANDILKSIYIKGKINDILSTDHNEEEISAEDLLIHNSKIKALAHSISELAAKLIELNRSFPIDSPKSNHIESEKTDDYEEDNLNPEYILGLIVNEPFFEL